MRPFWRSTWLGVFAATCLLFAGCDKDKDEEETPPPASTTTTTTTSSSLDEKGLYDVTVCIMPPASSGPGTPDVKEKVVKADQKTRVHWKSHGLAHKLRFVVWPFHDDPDETTKEGDVNYYWVKVPKDVDGESKTFILKKKLEPTVQERYEYKVYEDPPSTSTPPDGPAIIGEG